MEKKAITNRIKKYLNISLGGETRNERLETNVKRPERPRRRSKSIPSLDNLGCFNNSMGKHFRRITK